MGRLVYIYYPLLLLVLLAGAKFNKKGQWNGEFMSLSQTKALQGFCAICIMFHHIAQKTCASWLMPQVIVHGLDPFVRIGYLFVGIFLFCSGYGLYKSYNTKVDYLKGFVKRRILPIILSFYTSGLIFFVVRLLMGQVMDTREKVFFLTGIKLSNPNAWYVAVLPIFYLGFYLSFKLIKKEKLALISNFAIVFIYILIGTFINHNEYWMRGEWWYNTAIMFPVGMLFARKESTYTEKIQKHYILYLIASFIATLVFFRLSLLCQNIFSYYGETFNADCVVGRRWICLLSEQLTVISFVAFVFILCMKIRIGNPVLKFMGKITLEFYLIHGLFIELFGFSFLDTVPSLHYIRNVALMTLVIIVLSVPSALVLNCFHGLVCRKNIK